MAQGKCAPFLSNFSHRSDIEEPADVAAHEGSGEAIQDTQANEPYRPQRNRDLLKFHPALSEYFDWMDWAEQRIRELSHTKLAAETAHALARKHLQDLAVRVQVQEQQVTALHDQHNDTSRAEEKEKEEKEKWFDEKIAVLVKRGEEVKALAANATRPKNPPKVDLPLLDAVVNMGKMIQKARREMSNLVAGKKRPEQAFSKWENTYCQTSLDIVQLAEQVKKDRDKNQQLHIDQMANLLRREERVKLLEDYTDQVRKRHDRELREEQETFAQDQKEWRLQRANTLKGDEWEAVQEVWFSTQEARVRTQIWDEAKEASYGTAKEDLKEEHAAQCNREWGSGRQAGYEEGRKQGRSDIRKEFKAQIDGARADGYQEAKDEEEETKEMHYSEGYLKGLEVGNEEGYAKGREIGKGEGYAEGREACSEDANAALKTARGEVFFRALHLGVAMPSWPFQDFFKSDGTANELHRYWWGRTLAHYVRTQNL
jgi:hypothetical protein